MPEKLYFVTSIEFNENAQATNRTVPKQFTNRSDAEKEFYRLMYTNNGLVGIGWFNVITWDQYGNPVPELCKYWEAPPKPEPEPEPEEETEEEILVGMPPEEVV